MSENVRKCPNVRDTFPSPADTPGKPLATQKHLRPENRAAIEPPAAPEPAVCNASLSRDDGSAAMASALRAMPRPGRRRVAPSWRAKGVDIIDIPADGDRRRGAFVKSRGERWDDLSKGQRAMGHALLFPEAEHGGSRKKGASKETLLGFSNMPLSQARAVLRRPPLPGRCRTGRPPVLLVLLTFRALSSHTHTSAH
jgi:hypothetical protein